MSKTQEKNQNFWLISVFFSMMIVAFTSGCTNNLGISVKGSSNGISGTSSDPSASNGNGAFPITQVIKDPTTPSTLLDVLGDSSGTLGNLCQGAQGKSICQCAFAFTTSAGASQKLFSPVTYYEQNQVRCDYTIVPADITSINVSVYISTADTYSNVITFKFEGIGNTLDLTNPSSFSSVTRYQCRDSISIPYLFDGSGSGVYDPIQSEDPHLTYSLDYYTTNLGGAISSYVTNMAATQSYAANCHPNLNPGAYLTSPILDTYISNQNLNRYIYSQGAIGSSYQIYPPSSSNDDRSSFVLANRASGIFNIAVNTFTSPGVVSTLGYAASPIASTTSGEESCPTSASSIPTGYRWVKLWLFRSSLEARSYLMVSNSNLAVMCNPGDWGVVNGSDTFLQNIWGACPNDFTSEYTHLWTSTNRNGYQPSSNGSARANDANRTDVPPSYSLEDKQMESTLTSQTVIQSTTRSPQISSAVAFSTLSKRLVDRIVGFGSGANKSLCVRMNRLVDVGGVTASTYCNNLTPDSSATSGPACAMQDGTLNTVGDNWQLIWPEEYTQGDMSCATSTSTSVLGSDFCSILPSAWMAPSNAQVRSPKIAFSQFTTAYVNNGNPGEIENPRYDYIYVVTPVSIKFNQMNSALSDPSATSSILAYQPFRYKMESDCTSSPPINCSTNNRMNYTLVTGSDDPNGLGGYPLCTLQKVQ